MKRWGPALVLTILIVIGGSLAPPAHAEWSPPQHGCPSQYWKAHRNGRCGWHTVPLLIRRVFRYQSGTALCIAWRESRFFPRAVNHSSGAAGLYQFMPPWWRGRWYPLNPVTNTLHAFAASHGGTNWAPWGGGC